MIIIDEASKACRNLFAIFCGCRFSGEQNGTLNKNIALPIGQGLIGGAILMGVRYYEDY